MREKLFRKLRVSLSPREHIEPEEIFFDSQKLRQFEEGEETETEKLETPISSFAFGIFEIVQIGVIVFIAAFTAFIVLGKGESYINQSYDNSSRASLVSPERGLIYSSDGKILAENETYFDLLVESAKLKEYEISASKFLELSNIIGADLNKSSQTIYNKFLNAETKSLSEYEIAKGISREKIAKIDSLIMDYPFLVVREAPHRNYPPGQAFSHILGYTGEVTSSDLLFGEYSRGERVGKVGVEAFYDGILRGEPGVLIREINSNGDVLNQELTKEPVRGKDITLYVNAELQEEVSRILKRHAEALGINSALAIVLDAKTGGIISMVSLPGFDSNLFEQGISEDEFNRLIQDLRKPLFNRAVGGEYPSGSTIKPIIAAAALEEDIVSPSFLVYADGAIEVPSVYDSNVVYEFKDWKVHGWTDIRKAIADSVNVYFYTIGGGYKDQEGLGIQKIEEYLKKFNWGEQLGVDLPGEASGLIPTPKWKKEQKDENWYIGDTYLTSIGQGNILATPLQIAASTLVFASKGILFSPRVVSKIGDDKVEPIIIDKGFISEENLQVVMEGLRMAVETGSSKYLSDLPFSAAGKTGTAQTGRARNHAWFTGFAPYEDAEVVVTVLLEEGDKSDYAVRVAKEIFNAYFDIYPQN